MQVDDVTVVVLPSTNLFSVFIWTQTTLKPIPTITPFPSLASFGISYYINPSCTGHLDNVVN